MTPSTRTSRGSARRPPGELARTRAVLRLAAAVLLPAVVLLPAAVSAAGVSVTPAPAAAGTTTTFPPCIDVAFEADQVTGLPPLSFTWLSDTAEELMGNPVVIDTTGYPAGPHQMLLTVSNAAGSDQVMVPFEVEALLAGLPEAAANPVPGLQVTVGGSAEGYNEWRLVWGDGQATPWQPACVDPTVHTYAAAGTYPVRLEVRNCLETAVSSDPLLVTVGGVDLTVTDFSALGCAPWICVFDPGDELTFVQSFTLPPAILAYDWDGDGSTDELSALPVATHTYPDPGAYRPSVTAHWGTQQTTRLHALPIYVSSHPEPVAFYDGFEEGDLGCWSETVGAPPVPPGPGCFGVQ